MAGFTRQTSEALLAAAFCLFSFKLLSLAGVTRADVPLWASASEWHSAEPDSAVGVTQSSLQHASIETYSAAAEGSWVNDGSWPVTGGVKIQASAGNEVVSSDAGGLPEDKPEDAPLLAQGPTAEAKPQLEGFWAFAGKTKRLALVLAASVLLLAAGALVRVSLAKEEEKKPVPWEEEEQKIEMLKLLAKLQMAAETLSRAVDTREATLAFSALEDHLLAAEKALNKLGDPETWTEEDKQQYMQLMDFAEAAAARLQAAGRAEAERVAEAVKTISDTTKLPEKFKKDAEAHEQLQAAVLTLQVIEQELDSARKKAGVLASRVKGWQEVEGGPDIPRLLANSVVMQRLRGLYDSSLRAEEVHRALSAVTLHASEAAMLSHVRQLQMTVGVQAEVLSLLAIALLDQEMTNELQGGSPANVRLAENILRDARLLTLSYSAVVKDLRASDKWVSSEVPSGPAVSEEARLQSLAAALWSQLEATGDLDRLADKAAPQLQQALQIHAENTAEEARQDQKNIIEQLGKLEARVLMADEGHDLYPRKELARSLLARIRELRAAVKKPPKVTSEQLDVRSLLARAREQANLYSETAAVLQEAAGLSTQTAVFMQQALTQAQLLNVEFGILNLLQVDIAAFRFIQTRASRHSFTPVVGNSHKLSEAFSSFAAADQQAKEATSVLVLATGAAGMREAASKLEDLMAESNRRRLRSHREDGGVSASACWTALLAPASRLSPRAAGALLPCASAAACSFSFLVLNASPLRLAAQRRRQSALRRGRFLLQAGAARPALRQSPPASSRPRWLESQVTADGLCTRQAAGLEGRCLPGRRSRRVSPEGLQKAASRRSQAAAAWQSTAAAPAAARLLCLPLLRAAS
ncbi:hypothetical protein Efla_005456 [Eimeria flavescens]